MKSKKNFLSAMLIFSMATFGTGGIIGANAEVMPAEVEETMDIGTSIEIDKTVSVPEIPANIDICFLEDETGSFYDDIDILKGGADETIYDTITAFSPQANFAVAGFRDYPIDLFGAPGDHVYRLLSYMDPDKSEWLNGIDMLSALGGSDYPEAQYDAIVAAAGPGTFEDPSLGIQNNCGWREETEATGDIQRFLIVATDAEFHIPDGTHMNGEASTISALNDQDITLIGLKASGAGSELDALAAATGGSVQPLSSDGTNIATAILDGLQAVKTDVWPEVDTCDTGLTVDLAPLVHTDVPSGTSVNFVETILIADDPSLAGQHLSCAVDFYAGSYPETGTFLGRETIMIHVSEGDMDGPEIACIPTVNPNGKKIPPAGNSTMPGAKGGMNEDGFFELIANDESDENLEIWITDEFGSGPFGPYYSGDKVKITESPGATPSVKPMGSAKGQAGAILAHIILKGDAIIMTADSAGNTAEATCYVPPLPK